MLLYSVAIILVSLYCLLFAGLALFGFHRYWLVHRFYRHHDAVPTRPDLPGDLPTVLVQLPLFNERYVAERLLRAAANIDYPRDKLSIQVLDDSTDATVAKVEAIVAELQASGVPIQHVRRPERTGFKAGALAYGLGLDSSELVAVFDADFIPQRDFLLQTVGHFCDPGVGMVQTRWGNLNADYSTLTKIQAMMLDGHFVMEHGGRSRSGCFFNFNGTAGIWRRKAIDEAGGWVADTVTEDLDLSYRAQLEGWRFVYRPDVETPSELPVNILAFKTQQERWTRGATQTAKKLLGRVWRSQLPFACKVESSFHLLGNFSYVLMVGLALLLFPVYALRHHFGIDWVFWVDIPMLAAGTLALAAFYANAQREVGKSPWQGILRLPLLMGLGMGMSLNNARAVLEGWFQSGGEFVRTPKYRIESRGDEWRAKSYRPQRQRWNPVMEAALLLYLIATAVYSIYQGLWWTVPFLCIFVGGYGYVTVLTFMESSWLAGTKSKSAPPEPSPSPAR